MRVVLIFIGKFREGFVGRWRGGIRGEEVLSNNGMRIGKRRGGSGSGYSRGILGRDLGL